MAWEEKTDGYKSQQPGLFRHKAAQTSTVLGTSWVLTNLGALATMPPATTLSSASKRGETLRTSRAGPTTSPGMPPSCRRSVGYYSKHGLGILTYYR